MSVLSRGARQVLEELFDNGETDLIAEGRDVWVGTRRTSKRVLNELLRFCFVSAEEGYTGKLQRYFLNETGRWAFHNEDAAVSHVMKVIALAEKSET